MRPGGPQRNPVTRAAFRRQVWIQIYAPLTLGILLMAAVAAVLWSGRSAGASAWADASAILLILPVLALGLVPLILLAGGVYLVGMVMDRIPVPAQRIQAALREIERRADRIAHLSLRPFAIVGGARAGLVHGLRRLASIVQSQD